MHARAFFTSTIRNPQPDQSAFFLDRFRIRSRRPYHPREAARSRDFVGAWAVEMRGSQLTGEKLLKRWRRWLHTQASSVAHRQAEMRSALPNTTITGPITSRGTRPAFCELISGCLEARSRKHRWMPEMTQRAACPSEDSPHIRNAHALVAMNSMTTAVPGDAASTQELIPALARDKPRRVELGRSQGTAGGCTTVAGPNSSALHLPAISMSSFFCLLGVNHAALERARRIWRVGRAPRSRNQHLILPSTCGAASTRFTSRSRLCPRKLAVAAGLKRGIFALITVDRYVS